MKTAKLFLVVALAAASACAQDQSQPAGQASAPQTPPQGTGQWQRGGQGGMRMRGTMGTIQQISGSTLTIKLADGATGTVKLSGDTRLMKDRQPAKLADFKVGDNIMVRGDSAGENTWNAQMVALAPNRGEMAERMRGEMGKTIVAGKVKSIDAPKLTVERPDNVEQTIEADESTSFRKQAAGQPGGEGITLPDIKVGDTIFARGELKNGVFVPSNIMVMDPARMGQGFGGGRGFGAGRGTGTEPGGQKPQTTAPASTGTTPQTTPKQ
jgi:preprotein translocase subunit YajC